MLLSVGAALLGAGLLAAGAVTGLRQGEITGMPVAAPHHAAAVSGPHLPSQAPRSHGPRPPVRPLNSVPARGSRPHQAQQQQGTVRLADGSTAQLVHSHVGRDGELVIPDGILQASWWGVSFGAKSGTTVMAGHVNWDGTTGPFAQLWRARKGDPVTVIDKSGRRYRYQITKIVTLGKNELPARAGALFKQTGPHRLALATCGGAWVGGKLGYAANRVVIADPS